jgi:hypothetical protein
MIKFLKTLILIIIIGLLSSCGFDKYNAVTADTDDLRKGDERVYGESEEAAPRQAALEYPTPEDGAKRAAAIKKKWLGLEDSTAVTPAPIADSTKAVATPADTTKAVKP